MKKRNTNSTMLLSTSFFQQDRGFCVSWSCFTVTLHSQQSSSQIIRTRGCDFCFCMHLGIQNNAIIICKLNITFSDIVQIKWLQMCLISICLGKVFKCQLHEENNHGSWRLGVCNFLDSSTGILWNVQKEWGTICVSAEGFTVGAHQQCPARQ